MITPPAFAANDGPDSDEALMLRYSAGDAAAFDALYARHKGGLFRFILRQCPQRGVAEEIFQDVWMRLIQGRRSYETTARFRTYLYTIAHNRVVDFFRHASHEAFAAFADDAAAGAALESIAASRVDEPHVQAEARELGARILQLLDAMPAPQREAFLLYEEGGLSIGEIAAATHVGVEAAKSRLRYAVARLRAGLMETME